MALLTAALLRIGRRRVAPAGRSAIIGRLALAMLSGLIGVRGFAAGPDFVTEYRIKAAYLYNFTKFVAWPPDAFTAPDAPLVIGLLGANDTATSAIAATLAGKTTPNGRTVEVRRFTDVTAAAAGSQILFVARAAEIGAEQVRAAVGQRRVLVVGETEGFAESGGTINFVLSGDAVRFEINPHRAEVAGLRVSGSLASVARLVHERGAE